MDVSIIIVSFNTKDLLKQCIESIYEYTKDIDFEIIVVDNASSDGSQQMVKEVFPTVTLIESPENLGFGKANNLGSKYAKGEFLFFLNSDTIFIENSIKKLYDFFLENEKVLKIGVLGGLLVDEKGNQNTAWHQFSTPNTINNENIIFIINTLTHKLSSIITIITKKIKKASHSSQAKEINKMYLAVDFVLGADMLMRKDLFDTVHGFDECYFMYFEETDLQLNLFRKGYKNYIYNSTKIIHLEGASSGGGKLMSNKQRIIFHKSKINYMKKFFCKQYLFFKFLDKIALNLQIFSKKYTKDENRFYVKEISKNY